MINATPEHLWRFRLPRVEPRFVAVVAGERRELSNHLDTLLIDAEAKVVELSWRAVAPIPVKAQLLEAVIVTASGVEAKPRGQAASKRSLPVYR